MRYSIFLAPAALLLAFSCYRESDRILDNNVGQDPNRITTFSASLEGCPTEIKVYADEDMKVLWNAGDRISIFNKSTYNYQFEFMGDDGDTAGYFEEIPVEGEISGTPLSNIYSVYPYSENTTIDSNGKTISLTLPAEQHYREHSFGVGANTMVAVTNDSYLAFKNVGGYLALRFYGDDVSVSRITLKGNNHEKIAGNARVTVGVTPTLTMTESATESIMIICDPPVQLGTSKTEYKEFWFVIPPVTFTNGFTITVRDNQGGVYKKSTTKSFTVNRSTKDWMAALKVEPEVEVYPVDLGLPSGVKWGSCNLGASTPEEKGEFFAWGELQSKADYSWSTYKHYEAGRLSKYGSMDDTYILSAEDDVARMLLGEGWRIPTKHEFAELLEHCNLAWSESPAGYRLTSVHNGNSIFLSAEGYMDGAEWITDAASLARYWSASTGTYQEEAVFLDMRHSQGNTLSSGSTNRYMGMSIRPVYGVQQNIPEAKIQVEKREVGFGVVLLGKEVSEEVSVTNTGNAPLEYRVEYPDVQETTPSPNITIVGNAPGTSVVHVLAPGESDSFTVKYVPQGNGEEDRAEYEIKSNAVNGHARLSAFGAGIVMETEVRDVTNYEESGLELIYAEEDGTMFLMASDDEHAPRVGDYLVSGITEDHPYGFLVQVTEVMSEGSSPMQLPARAQAKLQKNLQTKSYNWKWFAVKCAVKAVNELFEAPTTIPFPVELNQVIVDQVTDSEGHILEFERNNNHYIEIPTFPVTLSGVTLSPKVSLQPQKLVFYLTIESRSIKQFSVDSDWNLDAELRIKAAAKSSAKGSIPLYHIILKPICFNIGGVPFVFTPLISFIASLEMGAGVSINFVPYKATMPIHASITFDFEKNKVLPYGEHEEMLEFNTEDLRNFEVSADLDTKIEADTYVKGSLNVNYSIGLDGCNYIGRVRGYRSAGESGILKSLKDIFSAEANIDLSARADIKFSLSDFLSESGEYNEKHEFSDKCTYAITTEPFVAFNLFGKPVVKIPLLGKEPLKLYKFNHWNIKSLMVADFTDLEISTVGDNLVMSANKYMPLMRYRLLPELEYGFTYKKVTDVGFINKNVRPYYLDAYGKDYVSDITKYNINGSIPLSELEEGVQYELYPYVLVNWWSDIFYNVNTRWMTDYFNSSNPQYKIYRKGTKFTYRDGGIVLDELDDVPGINL